MVGFATIAAVGGMAATALTTGFSVADLIKSKRLQKEADAEAEKAMAEARKFLDVNVYDALNIQMKPYDLEREAALTTGAQLIEAGRESERGAAAMAGRIQANQQSLNRDIQARMGKEMADLQKLSAAEESRLKDIKTQLYLDEVEGAQTASAMYDERAAQAAKNAISGVTSLVGQAAKLPALYNDTSLSEQEAFGKMQLTPDEMQKIGNINFAGLGTAGEGFTNLDFEKISQMSESEYNAFKKALTPEQYDMLMKNPQFRKLYRAADQKRLNPFEF
jgi:hypothetical protein